MLQPRIWKNTSCDLYSPYSGDCKNSADAERGQFERLAFIHHFFRREAQRLNHDLELDGEIVSQLMRETLEGNVGGLENLIRNICASAWTFGERDSGLLHIKAGLLPDRLLADAPFTLQQNSERVMIYRDGDAQPLFSGRHHEYQRLTENICSLCEELAQDNISVRTFEKLIYQNVTLYLDALMNQESTVSLQDKRLRFIEDVAKQSLSIMTFS